VRSGRVPAVVGKTYMLTEGEELWEKELPLKIEQFFQRVFN
jgi:major vault protein